MINLENENTQPETKNNNMLIFGGVIAAVIIIGGAVLLMNSNSSTTTATPSTTTRAAQTPTLPQNTAVATASALPSGSATSASVKTINLEGKNYTFNPKEIKVKKGEKVKVVLKVADMQHDFVVDELNARTKVGKTGETVEVEFTPNIAGEFEYYCSVGDHRAKGMTGTIIVE